MPRKLKYHESKLLKKVDFLNWKADGNLREVAVLSRTMAKRGASATEPLATVSCTQDETNLQ